MRRSDLRRRIQVLVFLVVPMGLAGASALGCGGGGGGGSSGTPPQLSNLNLPQTRFDWQSGGGRATVSMTVDYSDPESDIVSVRVEVDDGTSLDIPVGGPLPGPTGTLIGSIEFSTVVSGAYTAEIWAVDSAGNSSNRLHATIWIIGSTKLTDLSISAAAFDLPFVNPDFLGDYTATVNTTTTSTTVNATTFDPSSVLLVNGQPMLSGDASDLIELVVGVNQIDVAVTTAGVETDTYTIRILRNAIDLAQGAYIKASNTEFDDRIAESMAFSGDTLVVGSRLEDSAATGIDGNQADNSAMQSGAAYVYVRDAQGNWSQQAYVKASNTDAADSFGSAVCIDGDTLAIGAQEERSNTTGVNGDQDDNSMGGAGAAYVLTRDLAGVWTHQAYIKASNTGYDDGFGGAIALHGDTLAVGAPWERSSATGVDGDEGDNSLEGAGAAYLYVKEAGETWTQVAYVKASDTDASDHFGETLALNGDTLVVGAPERHMFTGGDASNETGGKAYVFIRDTGGDWSQQALIQPLTVERFHRFGAAVAIDGDTLAVGAPAGGDDTSGAVYVYTRDALGAWTEQARVLGTNTNKYDKFGSSVALRGDRLVVGAIGEDTGMSSGAGAAYVFDRNASGQWVQQAYVKADNREAGDELGSAIAIAGSSMIVGARFEDSAATGIDGDQSDNGAAGSGAVYVFE